MGQQLIKPANPYQSSSSTGYYDANSMKYVPGPLQNFAYPGQVQGASSTAGQNFGSTVKPTTSTTQAKPPAQSSSGGGGGNSGPSGPSDADYDALGVARGDRGGYDRVKAEIDARRGQQPTTYRTPEGFDFQGDQNAYMAEIDKAFGGVMDYLNQNVGVLNQNKTSAEQAAQADIQANQALLDSQKGSSLRSLEGQQEQGVARKEDALSQARRLYQELTGGVRQRFGGATSAGQAASEILGTQLQKGMGQVQQQYGQFEQDIARGVQDVEEKFNQGKMQLQQAGQQALAKIQSDFTSSIMQINNMRAASEQEKGAARLNALMNVRNQVNQIKMQEMTFQQQLDSMREQAKLNVSSFNQTSGAAVQSGAQSLNTLQPQASVYSTLQGGKTSTADPYVGQIGMSTNQGKKVWDPLKKQYVTVN